MFNRKSNFYEVKTFSDLDIDLNVWVSLFNGTCASNLPSEDMLKG